MFAFVSAGINAAKSAYRSLAQRSKVSAGTGECQTPGQCFIAGTLVLTATGLKKIEEIEVGDEVLAYDEETGEQAYKPVTRLFRNETEEWYHIRVNGEEIVCTGGHPFYILNAENDRNIVNFEGVKSSGIGKWICARELRASDKVLLSDGSCGIIETIGVETLSTPATTYNFEVADFHTYYVSDNKVLVHNKCAFAEFYDNPETLIGKSADEVGEALGEGWTRTAYGSKGDGWRFMDRFGNKIAYHSAGGRHKTAYYILQRANDSVRLKMVGIGYDPLNETRTVYHILNKLIP